MEALTRNELAWLEAADETGSRMTCVPHESEPHRLAKRGLLKCVDDGCRGSLPATFEITESGRTHLRAVLPPIGEW